MNQITPPLRESNRFFTWHEWQPIVADFIYHASMYSRRDMPVVLIYCCMNRN